MVIALEEHYVDREIADQFSGPAGGLGRTAERLLDIGKGRIKAMDEAGIDMQVISHVPRFSQVMNPEAAVVLTAQANNRVRDTAEAHPDRLAGFAILPMTDPPAAADELERSVTQLGLKGALVPSLTGGVFLDDKRFWPIFERAEALDVPIYIHPGTT